MNTVRTSFMIDSPHSIWRYAGPMATSQKVIIPFLILIFGNSFLSGIFPSVVDFATQVQITALASFIAWAYFTVLGLIIRLFLKNLTWARVIAVTITFATTELVRIQTVYSFIDPTSANTEYGESFQIAGALSTGLLILAIFSTTLGDLKNYRIAYATRLSQLEKLEGSLSNVEETVRNTQALVVSEVRKTLQTELNSALHMSSKKDAQATVLADELFRVSDEVVRPLSAAFAESSPTIAHTPPSTISSKVPARELLHLATTSSPFRPVELGIVSFLLTVATLLVASSILDVIYWVVFVGSVFVLNWWGMKFITPRLASWNLFPRVVVITVLTAVPFTLFVQFVFFPAIEGLETSPLLALYVFVLAAIIGWLMALSQGIEIAREQILRQLDVAQHQLHWSNVRAQCSLWLDQRRLALILHNQVQGNLLASAMKLKQSIGLDEKKMTDAITEVQQLIMEPLNIHRDRRAAKKFSDLEKEINNTWAPLITLTAHCDQTLVASLESDPVAFEIVSEMMSEFQTNSLKHGGASQTTVDITQPAGNILAIRMRNNGRKMSTQEISLGLGSWFFESTALHHTTENLPDGVQFYLEIPFLPTASQ